MISDFAEWLLGLWVSFSSWILQLVIWSFVQAEIFAFQLYASITMQIAQVLHDLPRPAIFAEIESRFCGSWSLLGGLAAGVDLGGPITLVVSAAVARWLMRRIPFIGR